MHLRIVGKAVRDPIRFAVSVPAPRTVWNVRSNVLEAAQQDVVLRNHEEDSQHGDLDETAVRLESVVVEHVSLR